MGKAKADKNKGKAMTITGHLRELRKAVIISVIAVLAAFVLVLALGGDWLLDFVLHPMETRGIDIVFVDLAEAFVTKMKLSLLAGCILAFPVVVLQIWLYLRPALYVKERRFISLLFFVCLFLFALGVAFAYYVILGFAIDFFVMAGNGQAVPMLSIKNYVKFITGFVLPFGLMFQLPLVVFIIAKIGLINSKILRKVRKYVIFAIFVFAAVLTPPDVLSQMLLAIPMILLYELSIWIAKFAKVSKERQKTVADADAEADAEAENAEE